jgi:signal transduction histidine kinase/ActR/RegA family two-component response regulator
MIGISIPRRISTLPDAMEDLIDVLLVHRAGDGAENAAAIRAEIEGRGFRLQVATAEAGEKIHAQGGIGLVLCEFDGKEAALPLLKRVLKWAKSVPVVTIGPEHAALDAVVAGSEDHVSPERREQASSATLFKIAIERRRRRQAGEANEARLESLIQASADGLIIVDDSGTIRFANQAAEKLFDRKVEDLVGSVMGTPSGDDGVVELSIVRPDSNETISAEMRVVEIEWAGETGYIESIRDVTELKKEAQQARDAIRLRDHFLATLSHELRNPLAALSNAAQVLSLENGQVPSLKLPTEIIQRQCHQMVRILDDLLDISRISQGKVELRREYVSFGQLVSDCLQVMRPRIEHTHHIRVELPTETLTVHADPSRMQQVLVNLLTNAVKYTPGGGDITIRVERSGDEASLVICDKGHGISPEMLESIFEPFVQAEQTLARSDGGLGIGLAVVRRLVELHGGRVKATSLGLGRGSQFTLHLPLSDIGIQRPGKEAPDCATRFRICVVEDVADIAWMMRKLLEKLGHEVTVAPDGEQGVEMILGSCPDLAFVDVGLPGIDGYQVAERVRKDPRGRSMALIATTGYGQAEDLQRALDAGFDHHLVKPVSFEALKTRLVELASKRQSAGGG